MSYCCANCFNHRTIKNHIRKSERNGNCDYCNNRNVKVREPNELFDLFFPIINLYEIVEEVLYYDQMDDYTDTLCEKINNDWEVFNIDDISIQERLLQDMFPYSRFGHQLLESYVIDKDEFSPGSKISNSMMEMWSRFTHHIKGSNRFFLADKIDHIILKRMIKICEKKFSDNHLYRARINDSTETFNASEMGPPPAKMASAGRANPRGISYLYLADTKYTAIHEVRPFLGDVIDIADFHSNRTLTIIDLEHIGISNPFKYGDKLKEKIDYIDFLRYLGEQLSRPVNPKSGEIEYLPTQYLCEFIKSLRYDGIRYQSQLGDGSNYVFFNKNDFECRMIERCRISDMNPVEFTFSDLND